MRLQLQAALLLFGLILVARPLSAQLTAGRAEGVLHDSDGRPAPDRTIAITGGAGFHATIRTGPDGQFVLVAAYGRYRLSPEGTQNPQSPGIEIFIAPLQITHVELQTEPSGALTLTRLWAEEIPGMWSDTTAGLTFPEGFSLQSTLLNREPQSTTQPLDYNGLADNRLAFESRGALSWTDSQYKLNGMDATDAYQPGIPAILPNVQALSDVVVRGGLTQTGSGSFGTESNLFSAEPEASQEPEASWHGAVSSSDTGSLVTWANLPPPNEAGMVRQDDKFIWFTRDTVEAGGPLTKWADLYASAAGQWALQTVPLASPGTNQGSQMLFGDLRNRVRLSAHDQLDLLYSGSRVSLSNGGIPADLEDLMSRRMAPSFVLPGGFLNESEANQFNFLQAGWTHELPANSNLGLVQLRYGYSIAHLDTTPLQQAGAPQQSSIELLGGAVTGAPPIADLASQTRNELQGAWVLKPMRLGSTIHRIAVGGGWEGSSSTDRVTTPSDMNLVTANGGAAFAVEFNTPLVSQELVRSSVLWITDYARIAPGLSLDLGLFADFSRGSLPAQSSPAGAFAPARSFAAQPDLIAWNNPSLRVGVAWMVPHAHGLLARVGYFRLYAPLAGRYLDFGNPDSLGGNQYQWNDLNGDGLFEPGERGALLLRFGGPYSSISTFLRRPYADAVNAGLEISAEHWGRASVLVYRRCDNDRLAAVDTGVPPGAFTPVVINDPAPTFGPAPIEVFAQNPATFGQDHYLLTNPAGLRVLTDGILIELGTTWHSFTVHAWGNLEKSFGPTNPGNSVFENDPGIVGDLLMDPNTTVFATGRSFMDRAYTGKAQATYRLPASWGGIELAGTYDYIDGLPFGGELLVNGLPQGPFLVQSTQRGTSDQSGYRADNVRTWNLRLRRDFQLPAGELSGNLDILNVLNTAASLEESGVTNSAFILRLPLAVQPPRNFRIGLRYEF